MAWHQSSRNRNIGLPDGMEVTAVLGQRGSLSTGGRPARGLDTPAWVSIRRAERAYSTGAMRATRPAWRRPSTGGGLLDRRRAGTKRRRILERTEEGDPRLTRCKSLVRPRRRTLQ
jgi:hypothetical protein